MRNVGVSVLAGVVIAGCSATVGSTADDGDLLTGANEDTQEMSSELSQGVPVGSTLRSTAALNLRTGPSTGYRVRLVIPSGAVVTVVNTGTPQNAFYNVKYNGVVGFSHGNYLNRVGAPAAPSPGQPSGAGVDGALERAKSGVGFSYWWGHGRWLPGGLSASTRGACYGSCPNCSHSGSYGADCSGYVAKVWQVGPNNTDPRVDSHPYSTATFVNSTSQWSVVNRSSTRKGDALVYNTNGAGHIFFVEAGDGWGSMLAYEAKGCSAGIVRNWRTAGSAYRTIRRAGY